MKKLILIAYLILSFFLSLPSLAMCKSPGDMLWYFHTEYWRCSQIVMDPQGKIYFVGYKSSGVPKSTLYCFSQTGDSLWAVDINERVEADPLIIPQTGEFLLGSENSGELYCLKPDGSVNWIYEAGGSITQPAAIDTAGNIYFANQQKIYSLNPDGAFRWEYISNYGEIATPLSVSRDGNVYFGTEFSKLVALQNTGNQIFVSLLFNHVRGEPTIDSNGMIYVATSSIETGKSKIKAFYPDGSLAWEMTLNEPNPSAVIIGDSNNLYLRTINFWGGGYGNLYKIDKQTQNIVWQFYYGGTAGCGSTPTVASDGTCYFSTCGTQSGRFYAINPYGNIKWQFSTYQAGLDCSPLGSMFIGKNGNIFTYGMNSDYEGSYLIAIEEPDAQLTVSPWPMYRHDPYFTGLAENIILPQPNIYLSQQLFDFGYVEPGYQKTDTLCIKNLGNIELEFDWVLESNVFFVNEIISKNTNGNKFTEYIQPGDSLLFVLLFGPDSIAMFNDTLQLYTNDPDQPLVNILLKGKSTLEGEIKWTIQLSNICSAPAIDDFGTIYISGSKVWAINPGGNIKWEYTPPASTMRYDDENITISHDNQYLYYPRGKKVIALDSSGVEQWIFDPPANDWLSTISLDKSGRLYFGDMENFGGGYVYCLNKNGDELWNYYTGYDHFFAPAIDVAGNLYIGCLLGNTGNLYSLSNSGGLNWEKIYFAYSPATIGDNDIIYIGGYHGPLGNYQPCIRAYNTDGAILWETDLLDDYYEISTSIVIGAEGNLYFGTRSSYYNNGEIYAMNTDGNILWTKMFDGQVVSTPAIAKNGAINFGCKNGNFYVFDPDGIERWRIETGAIISSSPAIDNSGIIYFVDDNDFLYAVYGENGGLADTPWPMVQHDTKHTSSVDTLTVSVPENNFGEKNILNFKNYPNPVRGHTVFEYYLPQKSDVEIVIFDNHGKIIMNRSLFNQNPGKHYLTWKGRDDLGRKINMGLYICVLKVGSETMSIKIVVAE